MNPVAPVTKYPICKNLHPLRPSPYRGKPRGHKRHKLSDSSVMAVAESMSSVDRTWLLMERPTNPMVIMGLLILKRPLRRAALRELVEARFLAFERFRCVPVLDKLGGRWVPAEQF